MTRVENEQHLRQLVNRGCHDYIIDVDCWTNKSLAIYWKDGKLNVFSWCFEPENYTIVENAINDGKLYAIIK